MTFGAGTRRKQSKTGSSTKLGSVLGSLKSRTLRAGIPEGALGILAGCGIVGAALGTACIRTTAVVAVTVAVAGLFILLTTNKLKWRRRTEVDRRLLRHYCDLLHERSDQNWHISDWHQVVTIEANGDTRDKITFIAVSDCEALDFITFWEGPNWEGWPEKHRSKVDVRVRSVEVDGEGGSRFDVTSSWLSRGRLKVTVHLSEPATCGTEIHLEAEFFWPAKCLPFIQGTPEKFVKKFTPGPEHLEYTVILPPGCSSYYDSVGLKAGAERYSIQRNTTGNGREEIRLVADGIATGTRVGMRLDIK